MWWKIAPLQASQLNLKTELCEDDIWKGLAHVSNHLSNVHEESPEHLNLPIRIIVSGGVLSVVLYRNRKYTKDIDFFHFDGDTIRQILDSKDNVPKELQNWHGLWINCEVMAFVNRNENCEHFYDNSINQNLIIWKSDSLEVYAADLKFQLVGKIERAYTYPEMHEGNVSGTLRGRKDLDDAISILNYMIILNNQLPLLKKEVSRWYHFGRFLTEQHFEYTNQEFRQKYGFDGII